MTKEKRPEMKFGTVYESFRKENRKGKKKFKIEKELAERIEKVRRREDELLGIKAGA